MLEVKWVHVGQYRPYGNTFRIAEIHTELTLEKSDILKLVNHDGTPSYEEYKALPNATVLDYFRGWYFIEKTTYGYLYKKEEPYTD